MGLIDYISRLSNQKPKVTNKNDKDFAVAPSNRICEAISSVYTINAQPHSQSQHINAEIKTHSIRATNTQRKKITNFFCLN